ncbi:Tudor domain [Popillia japonica]|uniref:Tudor domain n=1 Tax=Popillia japonica TaxID=7064 RepID=A0AAW1NHW3_POPJA
MSYFFVFFTKIRRLLQKTPKPATPDNTVELLISKKIKNAIAKLQMLEKDLLTQMQKIRNQDKISLTTVQEQLIVNIRSVSNLINVSKQATDSRCSPKKLNIHLLKKQLEGVGNTPCYFLQNDKENADLEFLFEDTLIEDLQHSARLNFTESNPYSLVTRQELPPDYEDDETISIAKSVLSSASSLIDSIDSRSVREKAVPRKAAKSDHVEKWLQSTTPSGLNQQQHQQGKRLFPIKDIRDQHVEMPTFQKGDRETVKVTHLMSPECFYVQLGRMSGPLMRLSKTIDKHIRSKSVIIVQAPDINDLYLVKYMSDGQTHWCRGRVVEYLPEQKMYNVYFIDYGNTATVKREEIAMIPPDLKRLIPFAVKCKFFDLYPAKGGVWDSKAVYTMAKIIANNELLMIITEVSPDCLEVDLLTTDCDTSLRDALKFLGYGIPYCKYPTDLDNIKKQLKNTETLKLYANNDQFKKEESLDVIISYAINPYNIYINLKNSRNDLIKLHENMDNFYRDNKKD